MFSDYHLTSGWTNVVQGPSTSLCTSERSTSSSHQRDDSSPPPRPVPSPRNLSGLTINAMDRLERRTDAREYRRTDLAFHRYQQGRRTIRGWLVCMSLVHRNFRSFQLYSLSDALGKAFSFHLYSTVSMFITWFPTLFPEYNTYPLRP